MTKEEMQTQFDGEWVLVGDPELTELHDVKNGTVLCHSKDRDEVYRKMLELRPKHAATLCFVKTPDDVVIIL